MLESLVKVLRPLGNEKMNFDFRPYTDNIYQCCFVRLKASDIDQEVKERAISCMGQIGKLKKKKYLIRYFSVLTSNLATLHSEEMYFLLKNIS